MQHSIRERKVRCKACHSTHACRCSSTAEDLHVQLHTHLDKALQCMERIQGLHDDASWGEWAQDMKEKALKKVQELRDRMSKKKKKEDPHGSTQETQPASQPTQEEGRQNMYLVS